MRVLIVEYARVYVVANIVVTNGLITRQTASFSIILDAR
jgi:hypothetical protein